VGNNKRIFYVDDDSDYYAPSGLAAPLSINQQLRQSVATLFPSASIENPLAQIMRMRRVKDEHELVRMREASRISAMSLIEAAKIIQPGINALEVAARMEYVWAREGSQGVNHARMVAAGDTSLVLYSLQYENYNNGNRIMRSGELAYIDYGIAESDMYSSDVCRTFPVSGKFTPEQRKYYDIVVEAEEAALAAIRPGVTMLEVVRASAAVFKKYGLEKYEDINVMGVDKVWGIFPSPTHFLSETGTSGPDIELRVRALGHSIGLNIVAPLPSSTVLQPGMVFTVEPKLYIPSLGTGMMVEDVVVVTEEGYENLSVGVPKSADEIEALMAQ
jgi:Xaa-Pro aminopeptidase